MADIEKGVQRRLVGALHVEDESERALEIVEVGDFYRDAVEIIGEGELEQLRHVVATLRQLGTVIKGTHGLRKMRWEAKGKERGGARVLYYYGGDHMPIYLVAIYPKSHKADLTSAEKKAARKFIEVIDREHKARQFPLKLRVVVGPGGKRR